MEGSNHATQPKQNMPPPAAVRALDLTNDDIAAIAASEMAPGFEHLKCRAG